MTTITIDRALLEQTLQALVRTYHYGGVIAADAECITALRAALAQQAKPQGCDHCNHPLYAATRCRVCGRVTEQAEPVEPVAKMTAHRAVYFMARFKREEKMLGPNEQGALDFVISMLEAALAQEPTPPPEARTEAEKTAYAAGWWDALRKAQQAEPVQELPQRKPLTEEEIDAVWDQWFGAYGLRGPGGPYTRRGFARAVERAHGITDPQVADRLARHGIPMPEGDPK